MFGFYKPLKNRRAQRSLEPKERKKCPHIQIQMQDLSGIPPPSPDPLLSAASKNPSDHANAEAIFSEPCLLCKKERHDARVYRWKLMGGLFFAHFLAAVDLTIVAAALPFIASHFNKLDQLNWIVTSFTLTSTAFIPAYGQLADVYGRHFMLQVAVFIMLIGTTMCAATQSWAVLLLGRALQGTSAAGIPNLIQIILADNVSLKENAKNTTIFQFISGVSYGVGPVLGGYLTMIAVIAHIAIFFLLRKELVGGSHFTKGNRRVNFLPGLATIDIGGTILFIFGVGLIILATSWGGVTYAWTDAAVLAPLVIGSIMFGLFFVYEYYLEPGRVLGRLFPQQTPMIPSSLLTKDTVVLALLEGAAGAAMFSVFYFISIYFTLVEGYPAGKSGLQLLYYIPGLSVGAWLAMFACNVWPASTFPPLSLGAVIETAGISLLAWAVTVRKGVLVNGIMAISGAGTAMRIMPATLHAAGIWPDRIAPAMSIMRFSLPFGGTIALTIMGSVFNNKMASVFRPSGVESNADFNMTSASQSLNSIDNLPPEVQNMIRDQAKNAVMWAFISIIPICALALFAVTILGNVWIKSEKAKEEAQKKAREDNKPYSEEIISSEVITVPFLWAIATGNVDSNKFISTPLTKAEKERRAQITLEEQIRLRTLRKPQGTSPDPERG
ncbi:hypothetical protein FQN57_001904 [Myotisia sp. PD_48]|nr:hypothetical protein FQN57_001904 [Myotisia sp. PD_48]